MELQVKQISAIEWNAYNDNYDFNIRVEEDEYVIDAFDVYVINHDDAHLDTTNRHTFDEAIQACRDFDGSFTPEIFRPV